MRSGRELGSPLRLFESRDAQREELALFQRVVVVERAAAERQRGEGALVATEPPLLGRALLRHVRPLQLRQLTMELLAEHGHLLELDHGALVAHL